VQKSLSKTLINDANTTTVKKKIELSKWVTGPNPAQPTMGWPLSESTQPGSFISETKKIEPDPTHHELAG